MVETQILGQIRLVLLVLQNTAGSAALTYDLVLSRIGIYTAQILRLANRAEEQRHKARPQTERRRLPTNQNQKQTSHNELSQSGKAKGAGQMPLMAVYPRLLTVALA